MDFLVALAGFVGRNVEVFFANQFITGILTGVANGAFTVNVNNGSYAGPTTSTVVSIANVELVRILP